MIYLFILPVMNCTYLTLLHPVSGLHHVMLKIHEVLQNQNIHHSKTYLYAIHLKITKYKMCLVQQNARKHNINSKHLVFVVYLCFSSFKISHSQFVIPDDNNEPERLQPCHIPTGRPSFCVPTHRCPQIQALISNLKSPIPPDVGRYIKDMYTCTGVGTVCCPFNNIVKPKPTKRPTIRPREETCSVQDNSKTGTCTVYFKCNPLLQLISNLKQPLAKEVPRLMQTSILCGRENIGGLNLPKVCCPTEAVKLTDKERFDQHPNRRALAETCPIESIDARIVGGREAEIGKYPWLVLLGYTAGRGGSPQWKCGGVLIGDRYVLTAAHCVTGLPGSFQLSKIRVGEHKISHDGPDCDNDTPKHCNVGVQDFDVEQKNIIFHPEYNSPNVFQNDIALVKLNEKVSRNDYVTPICLPYADNVKEDYHFNTLGDELKAWVAGWGATDPRGRNTADSLQEIDLGVFDGRECRETYKARGGTLSEDSQLCVGGEKGRDSCVGDSGSGLMTADKKVGEVFGHWKLIGIVSFGPRLCGTDKVPGVYSRVRHYIDWILDNVEP